MDDAGCAVRIYPILDDGRLSLYHDDRLLSQLSSVVVPQAQLSVVSSMYAVSSSFVLIPQSRERQQFRG